MLPDRVSNPGPLTYESGALPIALRGPANINVQLAKMPIVIGRDWNKRSLKPFGRPCYKVHFLTQ